MWNTFVKCNIVIFFLMILHFVSIWYRGLPTRMVYLYYISCLRYTILVRNPRYIATLTDLVKWRSQQMKLFCHVDIQCDWWADHRTMLYGKQTVWPEYSLTDELITGPRCMGKRLLMPGLSTVWLMSWSQDHAVWETDCLAWSGSRATLSQTMKTVTEIVLNHEMFLDMSQALVWCHTAFSIACCVPCWPNRTDHIWSFQCLGLSHTVQKTW